MNQRSLILRVRVTPSEHQQIQHFAGEMSISQYLRTVALSGGFGREPVKRDLIAAVDAVGVILCELSQEYPHYQSRCQEIEQQLFAALSQVIPD